MMPLPLGLDLPFDAVTGRVRFDRVVLDVPEVRRRDDVVFEELAERPAVLRFVGEDLPPVPEVLRALLAAEARDDLDVDEDFATGDFDLELADDFFAEADRADDLVDDVDFALDDLDEAPDLAFVDLADEPAFDADFLAELAFELEDFLVVGISCFLH